MSHKEGSGIGWLLVGLGVGAVMGILFAPQSGSEMREVLLSKADEGKEFVRSLGTRSTRTCFGLDGSRQGCPEPAERPDSFRRRSRQTGLPRNHQHRRRWRGQEFVVLAHLALSER